MEQWSYLQPMNYPRQPENTKICPGCSTCLSNTAKRCAVCGYRFTAAEPETGKNETGLGKVQRRMRITLSLPALLGLILLLLAINTLLILGFQKRERTKVLVDAAQATSTYIATSFVTLTPSPTMSFTPAPPSETPLVDIEYTVVSGDSCLSIAKRFDIYLDSLVRKNDIDCALLNIGTVLKIPRPTAEPESTSTAVETVAP
jgi:hypothetical protein